ncbi:MAG: hypothetical protein M5U33_03360 [Pseudorhodoplanes sp.]|nr:hypothetical protein [Pseudorhodoplanes sp.]
MLNPTYFNEFTIRVPKKRCGVIEGRERRARRRSDSRLVLKSHDDLMIVARRRSNTDEGIGRLSTP